MENKSYIVAIDLGDSNVVVAVGSRTNVDELISVECIVSKPSEGVSAGKIVNIELAAASINNAIEEVRLKHGFEIYEAYAGISGEFVYCTGYTDHVFVPDPTNGVTSDDVKALFDRMRNVQVSDERTIMERIPQNYVVDDTIEVKNPVGSFGSRLSSTFNFIISDNTPIQRLEMAMRRQKIKVRRVFSNAVAVGDAVLSLDEKEEGVAVVDIGGGLTNIAIYYRNVVRYISTIPMGASSINNDIRTLMIPDRYIEPLKQRYGYAIADAAPKDVVVNVKGRTKREAKDIIIYNLATVIEARVKDIAEFVKQEIKDSSFAGKLPYGVVLTGGSSQLRGIDKLFRRIMDVDVRIAEPEEVISEKSRSKITSPSESTVIGLLLQGAKHGSCDVKIVEVEKPVAVVKEPEPPVKPFTPPPPRPVVEVVPTPVVENPVKPQAPYTIKKGNGTTPPTPLKEEAEEPKPQEEPKEEEKPMKGTKPVIGEKKQRRNFMSMFNNLVSSVNNRYSDDGDGDEVL